MYKQSRGLAKSMHRSSWFEEQGTIFLIVKRVSDSFCNRTQGLNIHLLLRLQSLPPYWPYIKMWALVFTGSSIYVTGTGFVHSEVILGAQGSIQSTLCGIVGVFWCQSTTGCRLNFCPLPKWNSLSSQYELSSTRERYDLRWIPVLFLQSLNKFEHYLTIQRDEWLFWCWGWRKSKCSGREDFHLWQCSRQNGSLIRVHTERAIFTIICITCNLL